MRKASTYLAVGATAIWRQSEDARGIFWAVRCVMLLNLAGLELAPDPRAWVGLSAPGDDPLRMPEVKNIETPAAYATMRSLAAGARSCSGGGSG